ncbi:MAG: hypothetical protein LBB68_00035 [Treponema sp.]|jgi:hypothetical protein|nr:hypothetical protein [Treponema sp.]
MKKFYLGDGDDGDSPGSGSDKPDSALVASWYRTQFDANAEIGDALEYVFTSDGKVLTRHWPGLIYSTSGGTITIKSNCYDALTANSSVFERINLALIKAKTKSAYYDMGTSIYKITGTALTLSYAFTLSTAERSILFAGTYYKKA